MFSDFGIFRRAPSMKEGLASVTSLAEAAKRIGVSDGEKEHNQALVGALELQNMASIAVPICLSALAREESRGSHYRTDFPTGRFDSSSMNIERGWDLVYHIPRPP
jgi:succinate dehydrogenase / fumarate reductase flavoprotein subunit